MRVTPRICKDAVSQVEGADIATIIHPFHQSTITPSPNSWLTQKLHLLNPNSYETVVGFYFHWAEPCHAKHLIKSLLKLVRDPELSN